MAARFKTKLYTFPSNSSITLSALLASVNDEYVSSVTFRAGSGNAAAITWAAPSGTAGGYMTAGEAATFDLAGKFVQTSEIVLTGTQDDTLYISVLS
jgi:hypothetical protein